MKKTIAAILFILITLSLNAEEQRTFKDSDEMKQFTSRAVMLIGQKRYAPAMEMIGNALNTTKDGILKLQMDVAQQLASVEPRYGQALDHFLYREDMREDTFYRLEYVVKQEKHITRWVFIFYKPKDRWQLNNFEWDDNIKKIFEDE